MADYIYKLEEMKKELSPLLQAKFNDEGLRELAFALRDGSIFEIVKELEEIQQLNECSLLNRRIKVVNEHKRQLADLSQRHKDESLKALPHNLTLIKARQEREREELVAQLETELRSTDQQIILELDQLVIDQQSTLQQAAVPFFKVSNNKQDTELMSALLQFIQRLTCSN